MIVYGCCYNDAAPAEAGLPLWRGGASSRTLAAPGIILREAVSVYRKRQRAGAAQKLAHGSGARTNAKRLGVRPSSAAFCRPIEGSWGSAPAPGAVRRASRRTLTRVSGAKRRICSHCRSFWRTRRPPAHAGRVCSPVPVKPLRLWGIRVRFRVLTTHGAASW